jgi:hypothetical protein
VPNVGYILNQNYRICGNSMLYVLGFGCDWKKYSPSQDFAVYVNLLRGFRDPENI